MTIQILDDSNSVVFQGSIEEFIAKFLDPIPEAATKAWVIGILREHLHVCGAECKLHHVSIRKLYDDMREKGLRKQTRSGETNDGR